MKNMIRNTFLSLSLIAASMAYGVVPAINVIVSDASGKAAFKGATNASGVFATTKLQPGNYVVQLNSTSPGVKGNNYSIVVSAGTKKVAANAISGEKLAGAGVAMKVAVGPGLNITGQVAAENKNSAPMGKNGKPMVWIAKQLGSNLAGHWAEADSAEAKQAMTSTSMSNDNLRNRQNQGVGLTGN
jgi:hypothetical protein